MPVSDLKAATQNAVTQEEYRQRYIQRLSSSTPQQLVQKSWELWKSFFELLRKYRDPDDDAVTDRPRPPGYWKDGAVRHLHTVIRNEQYTLELDEERSRLEIPVGMDLKEKYGLGYHDRLRLEVAGRPSWEGKQGRLEIVYDRDAESFTAHQTVGDEHNPPCRRDTSYTVTTSLATVDGGESVVAAVDIGAHTVAAVTTSAGDHLLFYGRPLFEQFRAQTEEIARLQSALPEGVWSSIRIRTLYQERGAQRNHAQDALIRQLGNWLALRGVSELVVGRLDDVRESHWSALVNEKTDLFWAHGQFRDRLGEVLEPEYGITVCEESEAGSSSRCPACDSEEVHRRGDFFLFQCMACGAEGHADIAGSINFLHDQTTHRLKQLDGWLMARPAAARENTTADGHHAPKSEDVTCLKWDDHAWTGKHAGRPETNEVPANRSTTRPGNGVPEGAGTHFRSA